MAKASSSRGGSGGPFDLDKLRELIEMMEQHGVTEVSLRRGDERWALRRGPVGGQAAVAPAPPPLSAPVPPPVPVEASTKPAEETGTFITSPTVGTFYSSPTPDDPPFVKVGSKVSPDSVVCIVEAMKVFNQIAAEISGTILEILVNNGDPVEFGQKLFRVQPG